LTEAEWTEFQKNIETIKIILFEIKEQIIIFQYSGNSFDVNLSSHRDFSEVESEIRYKIGLGEDVNFIGFGDWKILNSEMVFQHQIVKLVRTNWKMEKCECKLVDMQLNLFIGNTNIRT
jgi:hypothetical protein